jgi:hypothetical protein
VEAGLLPGAHKREQDSSHRWQIPVRALAHAGLLPAAQVAEDGTVPDHLRRVGSRKHLFRRRYSANPIHGDAFIPGDDIMVVSEAEKLRSMRCATTIRPS